MGALADGDRVDVLLIGGGVAAASTAGELRANGFEGTIALATRELEPPYHRPPITKELLAPSWHGSTEVYPTTWWEDQVVELLTRAAVSDLDVSGSEAVLANKRRIRFRHAVVATGAMVRRLALDGAALDGIHYLRTPSNAARLREEAGSASDVVLVGGSFVAVEVAASLALRGLSCTMVMQERGPLVNAFGTTVSEHVRRVLERGGVQLVCDTDVSAFTGEGRVSAVVTKEGQRIPADLVVVGAGALPDTKLAERAGLRIGPSGGVLCDSNLRTSAPTVYSAGDVCEYESVVHQRTLRVEHERHAMAQGATVARNILGADVPHDKVPYFWTCLADWAKLEYVGPAASWDEEILKGSTESGEFTVWYCAASRIVAALTSRRPADLDMAAELIARRATAAEIPTADRARVTRVVLPGERS